jgi:uncharacterized protein
MWRGGWLNPKLLKRAAWAAALLAVLALALDALWLEPAGLSVVHHKIALHKSGALGNLRIAVIADLHAGSPHIDAAKIENVVRRTNAEKPDLILLTGDYVVNGVVGRKEMPIEKIAPLFKPLHARLGVFALIGNHDRWSDAPHIAEVLEKAGIPVLENRSVMLRNAGMTFYLAGIGDEYTHAARPGEALAGIPAGATVLCATHSPDVFPRLPELCALTVAGHTHGGQVYLPLLGRLVVPSKYKQRYAAGLIAEHGRTLFVSVGIGTSILPVRFLVPPEISILEIEDHDERQPNRK